MTPIESEYESWKARRLAALKAPDGWLTLIGRYALEIGTARIGRAHDNDIQLPVGPDHVGTIRLHEKGGLAFAPADGGPDAILRPDPARPPRLRVGDLLLEITTFEGTHALRVRDTVSRAPERLTAIGTFPYDPSWRVTARWQALERPLRLRIDTAAGRQTEVESRHKALFLRDGRRFELLATHGTPEAPHFVFRDETSGLETYGPARFVFGEAARPGSVILDFNKAMNPPCAFSAHTTCPFPPKENILPIRVEAGELAPPPGLRSALAEIAFRSPGGRRPDGGARSEPA